MNSRSMSREERKRKSFYSTPQIWVEKSQKYLEKVFGENWQDEYYIWIAAAAPATYWQVWSILKTLGLQHLIRRTLP